jgi:hypothetical protein
MDNWECVFKAIKILKEGFIKMTKDEWLIEAKERIKDSQENIEELQEQYWTSRESGWSGAQREIRYYKELIKFLEKGIKLNE